MLCQICQRETPDRLSEKHHLIPRSKHGDSLNTIAVCVCCGDQIHQLFSNKELAKDYNTLQKILDNEKIIKWVKWVRNKPNDFSICMKRKK